MDSMFGFGGVCELCRRRVCAGEPATARCCVQTVNEKSHCGILSRAYEVLLAGCRLLDGGCDTACPWTHRCAPSASLHRR